MIPLTYDKETLIFSLKSKAIEESAYNLIKELVENGLASQKNYEVYIDHGQIVELDIHEQSILGLPEQYPFSIVIKSDSTLNDNNFRFIWYFAEHKYGGQLAYRRLGSILEFAGQPQYILSKRDFQLCSALDEFNNLPKSERSFISNLKSFAKIKSLSDESAVILDEYLKKEDVIKPDKISLNVQAFNGKVEIIPDIENPEYQSEFVNKFKRERNAKNTYNVQIGDKKTRIVIDEKNKQELSKIKEYNSRSQPEIIEIINNPIKYFDPENIDLEEFSKRVKEIGQYQPKFYNFITPYKSEWLPGISIEKGPGETGKIIIKNDQEYNELKKLLEIAKNNNLSHVNFKGEDIPLHDAHNLIKRYEGKSDPPDPLTSSNDYVLIPYENVEELEYEEAHETKIPDFSTLKFYPPPSLNSGINLFPHQKEGIAWMQSLHGISEGNVHFSGGLLADDMGLGKTLQALSFIDYHNSYHNQENRSYLVIAPISLLENWQNEIIKFFNFKLQPLLTFGGGLDEEIEKYCKNKIILTNYESMRTLKYQLVFGKINWASIFIDEAQKIKTPGTLTTNAVKSLKADFKVALTGTPVENTLVDLWCIMDFISPGLLGSAKDFVRKYQTPLSRDKTNIAELGEKLRNEIGFQILRRLKKDVLTELPPIEKFRKEVDMHEVQINAFKNIFKKDGDNESKKYMLEIIQKMKIISDHPYLIDKEISKVSEEELINTSAKLKATVEIIGEMKKRDEKVLIFTELRETQRMLQRIVKYKFGITPIILNGSTPASLKNEKSNKESRQKIIDKFQSKENFDVLILSQLATGVGLNITGANNVIHYTRHWNPAKENQATDRVHRIGQTKKVNVYYPISKCTEFKTFDEVLDELLINKMKLFGASLFPTEMSEVSIIEIFKELEIPIDKFPNKNIVNETMMDEMKPLIFERLVGKIYSLQNYEVIFTPINNDKGADIICLSSNNNLLIQVKHSNKSIGSNAVSEITAANNYYENVYSRIFKKSVVSNQNYTKAAIELAKTNDVKLDGREFMLGQLDKHSIDINDLN